MEENDSSFKTSINNLSKEKKLIARKHLGKDTTKEEPTLNELPTTKKILSQ